jgi:hypothetical protein
VLHALRHGRGQTPARFKPLHTSWYQEHQGRAIEPLRTAHLTDWCWLLLLQAMHSQLQGLRSALKKLIGANADDMDAAGDGMEEGGAAESEEL